MLSTGTASGKSLAYQLPVLTALATDPHATALYLSPTKALGADQLRAVTEMACDDPSLSSVHPCAYDGDTSTELRQWARAHSRWIFTNPTCCTSVCCPATTGGAGSSPGCGTSSSTNATPTVAYSAPTSR